jgi:hypothetical protein
MNSPVTESSIEDLAHALTDHLLSQSQKSIHRIDHLKVCVVCSCITIAGEADSYYCKQMAQEITRIFLNGRVQIRNNIIVTKRMHS